MTLNNTVQIGKWIKDQRMQQNMPQIMLADESYLSPQCVCQIENGKRCPSIDSFISIATALGYKIELVKES